MCGNGMNVLQWDEYGIIMDGCNIIMASTMEEENKKARDNALFKKLEELTMKIPSDPLLYKQDVEKYTEMFKEEFDLLQKDTMRKSERYGDLLIFLSRCVSYFPTQLGWLPFSIMSLLNELGHMLHPYNRRKSAACIMILRAKNILLAGESIEFLLRLCKLEDKELRATIYKYIVNDVRRMNKHHRNNAINAAVRKFICQYGEKHGDKTTQKCTQLMIELYKRNLWNDTPTVNAIAKGCFNLSSKVRLLSAHFLLASTEQLEELDQSSDDEIATTKFKKGIVKATKNNQKRHQKQKKRALRRMRKREIQSQKKHFMPIDLIYSPQQFAEKLFNVMNAKSTKYTHKLTYMGLLSRIIWRHRLIILPFYHNLIRFMTPKQKQVHKILTYFAESVHEIIPQEELKIIIKHIVEHFVNDRCSQFSMTIGLNTVRVVFEKKPQLIDEDLMLYLCSYYGYRNKNVTMAAKALINVVRELNPMLLEKKFRGRVEKQEQMLANPLQTRLAGADLLDHQGCNPVELDRILTDQDFKEIKKRLRKIEKEKENNLTTSHRQNTLLQQQNRNTQALLQSQSLQQDSEQEEDIQISEEDEQEEQNKGIQEEEQGQFEDMECQQEQGSDDDSDESVEECEQIKKELQLIEDSQKEQEQKEQKKVSFQERRNLDNDSLQFSSMEEQESSIDDNPHGFVRLEDIANYKKSKREKRDQLKQAPKQKFRHKPKEKKGGTTNIQKRKMKPLMMLRSKKNKIRHKEKQVKSKIRFLKAQLGKVRSGKEAKRLKQKKIKRINKKK